MRTSERTKNSFFIDFFVRLVREKPLGIVGAIIVVVMLFTGVFAELLAPFGMNEVMVGNPLSPPSSKFWLGTDDLGRDLLSRIIFGARISVIVGLAATSIATFISVFIGTISGYIGGAFDMIVQRFVDAFMCLPFLPMVLVIVALAGPGMLTVILSIGVLWGVNGSRWIRGIILSFRENIYVEASAAIGCPTGRILTRHLVPNILPFIITGFTNWLPSVILTEASLSFLGYGIPPPAPSWGAMLSGPGRENMFLAPWIAIWPGLALSVVVYGACMFGDAARDLLDPKLRGGAGRYGSGLRNEKQEKKMATGATEGQS